MGGETRGAGAMAGGLLLRRVGCALPGGWAPRLQASEALALPLPDPRGSGQGASACPQSPAAKGSVGLWGLFCISRRFHPMRLCLQSPGHWQGFPTGCTQKWGVLPHSFLPLVLRAVG